MELLIDYWDGQDTHVLSLAPPESWYAADLEAYCRDNPGAAVTLHCLSIDGDRHMQVCLGNAAGISNVRLEG